MVQVQLPSLGTLAGLPESCGQAAPGMGPSKKSLPWLTGYGAVPSPVSASVPASTTAVSVLGMSHGCSTEHRGRLCSVAGSGLPIAHQPPCSGRFRVPTAGVGLGCGACTAPLKHIRWGETDTTTASPSLHDTQASLGIAGKDLGSPSVRGRWVVRRDGTSWEEM